MTGLAEVRGGMGSGGEEGEEVQIWRTTSGPQFCFSQRYNLKEEKQRHQGSYML